jgi:hypothetical protein
MKGATSAHSVKHVCIACVHLCELLWNTSLFKCIFNPFHVLKDISCLGIVHLWYLIISMKIISPSTSWRFRMYVFCLNYLRSTNLCNDFFYFPKPLSHTINKCNSHLNSRIWSVIFKGSSWSFEDRIMYIQICMWMIVFIHCMWWKLVEQTDKIVV